MEHEGDSRRPRHDTRSAILDAARHRLNTHGLASVTLDAVGADVGVTKQAVLYHFKSKDRLLGELLLERIAAESAALCAALVEARDGPDAIERFLSAFINHYLADLPGFRLCYLLGQTSPVVESIDPELAPELHATTGAAYAALEQAIARDPRTPPGVDPRRLAVAVHLAAVGHVCMHGATEAVKDPLKHSVRELAHELAAALGRGWAS